MIKEFNEGLPAEKKKIQLRQGDRFARGISRLSILHTIAP